MELKPPIKFDTTNWKKTVFLGGSINMGTSSDWQSEVAKRLTKKFTGLWVFNPRRDDWNVDAKQNIDDKYFRTQVEWEMHHLDKCSFAFFNIEKEGHSPISLYELGYMSQRNAKLILCAHPEFFRFGNLQIYNKLEHFEMFTNLEEALIELEKEIERQ